MAQAGTIAWPGIMAAFEKMVVPAEWVNIPSDHPSYSSLPGSDYLRLGPDPQIRGGPQALREILTEGIRDVVC